MNTRTAAEADPSEPLDHVREALPSGRLTLAAALVLRQDVTVVADAGVRARSVLAGAVGLAEVPVCGAFIHV